MVFIAIACHAPTITIPNHAVLSFVQNTGTQPFDSCCLTSCRKNISEEETKNITDNQSTKNIRDEIDSSQHRFSFNFRIQSQCQKQTDDIYNDRTNNCIFKSKQVRSSHAGVGKQIFVVSKSDKIIGSISFEVCKTIDKNL